MRINHTGIKKAKLDSRKRFKAFEAEARAKWPDTCTQ